MRFASADRFLIAASAGSPYVNVYQAPDSDWRGVRSPVLSIKVLSNEDYLRARISREDGGPKGIDINNAMDVLVMTCEQHPLAFFDLDPILKNAHLQSSLASPKSVKLLGGRKALEVRYQLYLGKITAAFTASCPVGADEDSHSELVTKQGKEALESAVSNKAFLKLA